MASSLQVIEHLQERFAAQEMTENALGIRVFLSEGRQQLVFAVVLEEGLVLKSPFAAIEAAKPSRVLELNQLRSFGVQSFLGQYSVVTFLPIGSIRSSEIDLVVHLVATEADWMQSQLTATDDY